MSCAVRIGLDARRLYGKRRGVGQYIFRLVQHLPELTEEFEFLLFADHRLPAEVVPKGCQQVLVGKPFSTESQSISGLWSKGYSIFWMNSLVPKTLRRKDVNLFHGTNFAIPILKEGPFVVTIHDMIYARVPNGYENIYKNYHRFLLPRAAMNAAKIITVSENGRRDIIELLKVPPEKVVTIHNGVDEDFRVLDDGEYLNIVRQTLKLPHRYILYVGAIERRKNLGVLVQAAAEILKEGIVDGLVLAGEEGYGAKLTWEKIEETKIQEKVLHIGYVPQEMMCGLYNLAEVFVMVSPYEGFGIPVLEAMACGTPVITSNCSSLPEVAGDAALLVSPSEKEELTAALRRILTDKNLRAELRAKGLKRVKQFSWRKSAEKHLEVYREVLSNI